MRYKKIITLFALGKENHMSSGRDAGILCNFCKKKKNAKRNNLRYELW